MAQLLFSPGHDRQCVKVTILEDDILEGPEDFQTTLSTSVDRVTLDPQMATVNVADDDGMVELLCMSPCLGQFILFTGGNMIVQL